MTAAPDYTSKVPYYTFPDTLAEQEEALATNPLLQRMLAARRSYAGDPHRPIYHYINPEANLKRPQWTVLLAGSLPSLLPSLSTGGYPPALGPCHKRRSRPLARPAVLHLSEPGALAVFRVPR